MQHFMHFLLPGFVHTATSILSFQDELEISSRAAGVTTVLNAAPARADVPEALLAATDILCVNQTEAEVMSGKSEVEAAALALRSKGCRCVIITLVQHPPPGQPNCVQGAEGALVLGKEGESVRVSGAPVEKEVVDTTGAGDAFVGSLAFFLACRCLSYSSWYAGALHTLPLLPP